MLIDKHFQEIFNLFLGLHNSHINIYCLLIYDLYAFFRFILKDFFYFFQRCNFQAQ